MSWNDDIVSWNDDIVSWNDDIVSWNDDRVLEWIFREQKTTLGNNF